ncbi:MAG: FliO/MopB family protein [Planctomycetota bacterium]|jgi:flagellar biogenesis protein FliO
MNDMVDQQNGGCGRVAELPTTSGVVVVGVLAALLAVSTYASDEGAGEPGGPRVGLNQSVTLDGTEPAPDPADVSAASTQDLPESQEIVARTTPMPESTQQRRLLRRASRSDTSKIKPKSESTPWHKTGLGALAIVLGVVGGLYYLVRRWVPSIRAADNGVVRVIGRTSLTPKHHVALIQLGRRYLAVGMSGDRMATLCEVHDPEEAAELGVRAGVTQGAGLSPRGVARKTAGFDDLLFHETAEYHELPEEADEAPVPSAGRASTSRRPVRDLLQRLQALRSK